MNQPAERPNILFIITDQHRADHVGFMGNDVVRTPNLDGIAARGMVFDNAWVANPVCMPNRSTLMTGRMPSAHGVIFNDRSLEWGVNTWVSTLRSAGYRTGLFGKSHLQQGMSRQSVVEADEAPAVQDPYPFGWNQLEDYERFLDGTPEWPDDFYGFDTVELSMDHGARVTGHHLRWALDRGARLEDMVVPYDADSPSTRRSDSWWQIYKPTYPADLHSTSFVAERTISFIDEVQANAEPWVAWASFPDPHHPMSPPGEWFDRHDPADMQLSASIDDPLASAPAYLRRMQKVTADQQRMWVQPFGASDRQLVRESIAATYGMIEMIDDGVGKILSAVAASGASDNTVVVFTSDHGDMMGDHGLMLKGFMPFQGTLRVPMVIADPRRSAGRSASLASSVDIASTMLALAGVDEFNGMQGKSQLAVLDDPTSSVRDEILVEDDAPSTMRGIPDKTRTLVTSDGLKYTRNSHGDEMLFDLPADGLELNDLSEIDTPRRQASLERLTDALIDTVDQARGAPVKQRFTAPLGPTFVGHAPRH